MKLNDIHDITCPDCATSRVVAETQNGNHCNGRAWESRTFECGRTVEFVPNFMSTRVIRECSKSSGYRDKVAKRAALYDAIVKLVERSDADVEYKESFTKYHYKPIE